MQIVDAQIHNWGQGLPSALAGDAFYSRRGDPTDE
jgi:hypothetical protein